MHRWPDGKFRHINSATMCHGRNPARTGNRQLPDLLHRPGYEQYFCMQLIAGKCPCLAFADPELISQEASEFFCESLFAVLRALRHLVMATEAAENPRFECCSSEPAALHLAGTPRAGKRVHGIACPLLFHTYQAQAGISVKINARMTLPKRSIHSRSDDRYSPKK